MTVKDRPATAREETPDHCILISRQLHVRCRPLGASVRIAHRDDGIVRPVQEQPNQIQARRAHYLAIRCSGNPLGGIDVENQGR
jgi:hypothetical protein